MKELRRLFLIVTCILFSTFPTTVFAADYTVVANDSLYKISQLFNTPITTIKQDNHLTTDILYPGQVLYVPAKLHTVIYGDSLFTIARQYGAPLDSLRKANNKWDNLIVPGQQFMIPGTKPVGGANTVIPYANSELDLLARLIEAEAAGEIYEAKVAVGAVVVNRVQSTEWPSTITSVINHVAGGYYQFTPVKNGSINKPASSDSIRAAWAALYGSDPSKDALFYFDNSSTNQWLWSKTITAYIDNMVFAK